VAYGAGRQQTFATSIALGHRARSRVPLGVRLGGGDPLTPRRSLPDRGRGRKGTESGSVRSWQALSFDLWVRLRGQSGERRAGCPGASCEHGKRATPGPLPAQRLRATSVLPGTARRRVAHPSPKGPPPGSRGACRGAPGRPLGHHHPRAHAPGLRRPGLRPYATGAALREDRPSGSPPAPLRRDLRTRSQRSRAL